MGDETDLSRLDGVLIDECRPSELLHRQQQQPRIPNHKQGCSEASEIQGEVSSKVW